MKIRFIITLMFGIFLLTSCSNVGTDSEDVKDLVTSYSGDQTTKQSASITGTELIITEEDGEETSYSLPEDEFFVSIAPFKTFTHPCTNHSLTGCQGELTSETFEVYIEDSKGNVIIDDQMMTGKNGFIDIWLPSQDSYSVTITQDNEETQAEISTYDDSPTCITTMQLS